MSAAFWAHMASGTTTVARACAVTRRDGIALGFTDHDADLEFAGVVFRAGSGLTAKALAQATGLSVDNTEAFGALSSDAITEGDIRAGRYDGAEVRFWLVNWAAPEEHVLQFRGSLGDVTRGGGAFTAELRGLSETLNQPQGRVYHPDCAAVLGDAACGFDLGQAGFFEERPVERVEEGRVFAFNEFDGFADRWFEKGRFRVLTGAASGLAGVVKGDRLIGTRGRTVELWQSLSPAPSMGDMVRIEAGCDRRTGTCQEKFANFLNFRGFPDIPGDDWSMAYPVRGGGNSGGSRRG